LEGALGSTLITFQTEDYARHFVQTASRILAAEAVEGGCMLDDRLIRITCSPIGIDLADLQHSILEPQAVAAASFLREKYAGKRLLVSRDKFDHIRGLKPKLLAYERFLGDHPEWHEKVVFIQVALLGAESEEDQLLSDVNEIVTRVNSMYGNIIYQPLLFRHQDFEFLDYLGMLCAADALVITSFREGWNLTSHEYVVCQQHNGHHPLLLSEFVGSASVFTDAAILVNPWDIKGMADAIHQALSMSRHEADIRWERAFHHVQTHDATVWVTGFLNELKHAYIEQQRGVPTVIPKLHMETYVHNYTQSDKRLFLLDFEGMGLQRLR
jgi:trehalose 6-phosphate synthase/phosphatase